MLNRDYMNNADPAEVAAAGMSIVDRLQHYKPHAQVLAAACVFLSLAEYYRVPAQDAFQVAKNVMTDMTSKSNSSAGSSDRQPACL